MSTNFKEFAIEQSPAGPEVMSSYSILTLNIHKGFSMGNRRFTLENIRRCLRNSSANIVFLQEVVGENTRFHRRVAGWPQGGSQLEFLADTVWSHHAYGKNAIYQHGHHGNAILSEAPFKNWHNLDVTCMTMSQRGILHGATSEDVHLMCVHLGLFEGERRLQISRLIDYVHNHIPKSAPLIIAGDFNDWRRHCHHRLMRNLDLEEAHQAHNRSVAKTYPALRPMLAMDRIYVRGFKVRQCSTMTGPEWRSVSDHCALLAEVSLQS
ncbi:MAG: endonuclease/exonuclease/phosphatase family protein [Pseudohongiellaceae bacterium]